MPEYPPTDALFAHYHLQSPLDPLRTTGANGQPATVTGITFDFNRIGETSGTSDHGYLTFHFDDGSIQTLGGHSMPEPASLPNALIMESRSDTPPLDGPNRLTASFELHHPDGMSMDDYAKKLTQLAKNYNLHPLEYRPIGEESYNSTSIAASLVAAAGGRVAVADLDAVSQQIGVRPEVTLTNNSSVATDRQAMDDVARRSLQGRDTATGLDHASLPRDRFTTGPVAPFEVRGLSTGLDQTGRYVGDLATYEANRAQQSVQLGVERALGEKPSEITFDSGGRQQSRASFTQGGRLEIVNDNFIVQNTGRGVIVYPRAQFELGAADRSQVDAALQVGTSVTISFSNGQLSVMPTQDRSLTQHR